MPRAFTLQDILGVLDNQSRSKVSLNASETINTFLFTQENLGIAAVASYTTFMSYPGLLIGQDGPLLYWRLDDPLSSTTVFDSNPYGPKYIGTVHGTMTFQVAGSMSGSKAATFNGSTGYLSATVNPVGFITNNLTLEAWIKTTSATQQYIYSWSPATFFVDTTGRLNTFDGTTTLTTTQTVRDGNWHHVAATWLSGTGTTIYLDGVSVKTGAQTLNPTSSNFFVGQSGSGTNFWNGQLDELCVYNTTLSVAHLALHRTWAQTAGVDAGAWNPATTFYGSKYNRFFYPKPPALMGSNLWNTGRWGIMQWG